MHPTRPPVNPFRRPAYPVPVRACPTCGRIDRTRWVQSLHASAPSDARFAPPHAPRHYRSIVPATLLGAWVTVIALAWMVSHLVDRAAWAFVAGLAVLLLLITACFGLAWWRFLRKDVVS